MPYYPGDIFYTEFVSTNTSGAVGNFDSLPTAHLFKNAVDDFSVNVFVSNVDLGRYSLSGLIPNYSLPAEVGVVVSGYIQGLLQKGTFDFGPLQRAVSVTGVAPTNFLPIGSISPGVTVSVTGTLPQVVVASGGFDQVIMDGNANFRQVVNIMASVIAGSSTVNGNQISYFAFNNNAITRVQATAASGARQSIVLILP